MAEEAPPAVVITAEGDSFSAGADLFKVLDEGKEYVDASVGALTAAFGSLFEFPRPLVAAVNGHAIAGGAVITCAADYRIMADGDGRIGVTELRVGVPYPIYALEIIRFGVAPQHLQELVYLAKVYPPHEAKEKGFVDDVVPPDELMERALKVASILGSIPTQSFEVMKKLLRAPTMDRIARYGGEHDVKARAGWVSEDVKAAIARFLEKTFGPHA